MVWFALLFLSLLILGLNMEVRAVNLRMDGLRRIVIQELKEIDRLNMPDED